MRRNQWPAWVEIRNGIQFDSLRPDQAEKQFMRVLPDFQEYTRPRRYVESGKLRLSKLRTLIPGDFATVVHRRALGMPTMPSEGEGGKARQRIHGIGLSQRLLRAGWRTQKFAVKP